MMNEQTLRALIDELEDFQANARHDSDEAVPSEVKSFFDGKAIGLEVALRRLYDLLPGDE